MGSVPISAAIVVIMMGRKRTRQASWIASRAPFPAFRASIAKSTIMMPFFFTSPTSMMMPTKA